MPRSLRPDDCVRAARPDDLAALAGVERAAATLLRAAGIQGAFLDEVTPFEEFAEAQSDGHLWVAVHRDRCVGFALVLVLEDGEPWLEELDVHPDHGRRGLGRALVERVIEWARDHGARSLALSTFRDVAWNAPFYSSLGFHALTREEESPAHREVVADETRRGLPAEDRVVMRVALETVSPRS